MARFHKGDFLSSLAEEVDGPRLVVFSANGVVSAGRLTMGAGAAKAVRDAFPGVDAAFGRIIGRGVREFRFRAVWMSPEMAIGALQVKHHWRKPADLALMTRSLEEFAGYLYYNHFRRVDMNYPGIGLGGLDEADVYPLLGGLPEYVHVWKL